MSDSHCLSLSLPSARRGWFSVVALTLATFAVVTTEMLPVGLLTPVAAEFRVPQAYVSLMLTIPAMVAALCSPLIILFTGRLNRRYLLMILMLLLMVANICAATATHFSVLVAARIIVGLSIGGIWAIAGGIAVRLVDSRHVALATSLIFAGVAAASVLGIPAGVILGEWVGWRGVFGIMSLFSLAVLLLMLNLPSLPPVQAPVVRDFLTQLRRPVIRTGLLITLLLVAAHFMAFTFVRPLLQQNPQLQAHKLSGLLALYGIAGIAGNFVLGLLSGRHLFRAVFYITGGIALSLAGLLLLPAVPVSHTIILTLWGMAYGGVSVTLMNWMIRYSAQAIEVTGSLYIAFFNTGIAAGSAAGGIMVSAFALQGNVIAALICTAMVLILISGFVLRLYRPGCDRQANLDQV